MQEKASITAQSPNPLTKGLCLCFPYCFSSVFSESWEAISTLLACFYLNIDYLCPILARAHYARKTPSKYDIFDTLIRHF